MTKNLLYVCSAMLILSACATSPTGRSQLVLLPEDQMQTLGARSFEELKTKTPIESDAQIKSYVNCVAQAILKANADQLDQKSWEVVVFRSADVNAFALPGGKIGVYTGLLGVAKNPSQLAAVVGHEVGHVLARHGNERVSAGLAAQGVMIAADKAFQTSQYRSLILAGLGVGTQFGVLLPHSRSHESEADLIGLKFMARAGFDPSESVALWKNMAQANSSQPPEWMSTHPSHSTRIRDLEANIPKVEGMYQAYVKTNPASPCALPKK